MPDPTCPHGCGRPAHDQPAIACPILGLPACGKLHVNRQRGVAKVARQARVEDLTKASRSITDIAAILGVTRRTVIRDRAEIRAGAA